MAPTERSQSRPGKRSRPSSGAGDSVDGMARGVSRQEVDACSHDDQVKRSFGKDLASRLRNQAGPAKAHRHSPIGVGDDAVQKEDHPRLREGTVALIKHRPVHPVGLKGDAQLLALTTEVEMGDAGGWSTSGSLGIVGVASGLAWGLGYFGQPHILARFMGIRSTSAVPKARKIAVTWGVTAMVAAVLVGLSGIVFFSEQLSNPEAVCIGLVQDVMNPWIGLSFWRQSWERS